MEHQPRHPFQSALDITWEAYGDVIVMKLQDGEAKKIEKLAEKAEGPFKC